MSSTANVDRAEVRKFEELASRWWDPNSEFKPLHDINPLRLDYIDHHAGGLAGKRVLDVGCGGGILSEAMAARGAEVTGIDMGEAPLEVARLHLLESGLEVDYRRMPAEELAAAEPAAGFDQVVAGADHRGRVFFSTINRNPKAYLFAIIGAEYLLHLLPKGTHDYAKFIRPSELVRWATAAGLEARDLTGMTYNPLTGVYRLDPEDVSVNYLVACERPA